MKKITTIFVCMLLSASALVVSEAKQDGKQFTSDNRLVGGSNETLVATYLFDEGNGTVAHDSSGNNLTGTILNPTWVEGAGYNGSALHFDKETNRYIIVEDHYMFDLSTFTISAMVRPMANFSEWPRGYQAIVAKEYQYILRFFGNYTDGRVGISAIYFIGNNCFAHRAATVFFDQINESLWPQIGEWNTIKMVYNGTSLQLYVNDNLLKETYSPETEYPPHFSESALLIGNHRWGTGPPPETSDDEFIGDIDFVEIRGEPVYDLYKIDVDIKGGVKVNLMIQNQGTAAVSGFNIDMDITGGIIRGSRQFSYQTFSYLPIGENEIQSLRVIGLGQVIITVSVSAENIPQVTKSINALIVGRFIISLEDAL
jgi:hypothetical protein